MRNILNIREYEMAPRIFKNHSFLQNKYKKFIFLFFNLNKFILPKKEQLFINKL